jgi:hypothetical protein
MSEGGVSLLRKVTPHQRRKIFERLDQVDSEGCRELKLYVGKLRRQRQSAKRFVPEEFRGTGPDALLVPEEKIEGTECTVLHWVNPDEYRLYLASLFAAGLSLREVSEKSGLSELKITQMVTKRDIAQARKKIPFGLILDAADAKVYRDLIEDKITKETAIADQIASRRRGLGLEAVKIARSPDSGLDPAEREAIRKRHEDWFETSKASKLIKAEVVEEIKDEGDGS